MAELTKTLSYPAILLITINSIMGTGIFFLPAVGAGMAGPSSVLSWLIMAVLSMGIALIFAELVGMYPFAGGVYEYTKQAFGPLVSFIIGWMTMIAGNVTIAMLMVGAVQYISPTLPGIFKILISVGFILAFNYMAYRGMQTSAVMLVAFAIVTLSTLIVLLVPGLLSFSLENFTPFFPFDNSALLVFLTIFFIAETFFGWETATFLAEETKNAKHVVPKAMWVSTAIIGVIVMLFILTSLSSISWDVFGLSSAPLSDLAIVHYGLWASPIIALMVYLSIIGSVAGWIVSAPRLLMSLAEDKLFIPQLAEIHPVYKTPYKSIIFQTVLTSILVFIGAGNYETLLHLLLPVVLILYSMVIVSFIVLRFKKPHIERPFKLWMGVPLAVSLILFLGALLTTWLIVDPSAIQTFQLVGGFVLMGVPLFFLLAFYYNPDMIIRVMENSAYFNRIFEWLILPKRIRKEIISTLPNLKNKKIFEYGAGVGTLTHLLATHVGKEGSIIASDLGKKNLEILDRRLKKKQHVNYTIIHDPRQINRIHPDVPFVDVVVSVGMLAYIQDLQKVLGELSAILPEKGHVCFVEYVDYFWILPNAGYLRDEKLLIQMFQNAGFRVDYVKLRGLFWKYLMVYGQKTKHAEKMYI